jgi:hypothetical protein
VSAKMTGSRAERLALRVGPRLRPFRQCPDELGVGAKVLSGWALILNSTTRFSARRADERATRRRDRSQSASSINYWRLWLARAPRLWVARVSMRQVRFIGRRLERTQQSVPSNQLVG